MIEFVFGAKGSGKTKRMIDMANDELETTKGDVIFVNDRDHYRATVNNRIRFVDTADYHIRGPEEFFGFLCGLMASNYDIRAIYLDNLLRIIDADGPASVEGLLKKIEALPGAEDIKYVLSISADEETVPDFMKSK